MKKLSYLAMAVIFAASVTSCKKERDCKCEYSDGSEQSFPMAEAKKKDHKDACDVIETGQKFIDAGVSCDLD